MRQQPISDAHQVCFGVHPTLEGRHAPTSPTIHIHPPALTLRQVRTLVPGSSELRDSAFFRNSVSSQHGAEGFYCEPFPSVRSLCAPSVRAGAVPVGTDEPLLLCSFCAVCPGKRRCRTSVSTVAVDYPQPVCRRAGSGCVSVRSATTVRRAA